MKQIFILAAMLFFPALALAQNSEEKDLNYWAKEVASRLKVTGYAQAGYTATMPEEGAGTNTFDMKRAILMVSAEITPKFYGYFMHEFKGGNMQEYYLEYRQSKAFNVRLGQCKTELSIENPMSPTVLENINSMSMAVGWLCGRDPLINNASGRDMGLKVFGDLFDNHLRYVVQVVNGGQINTNDRNNQKNVIVKLDYKPVPNFLLSVSGQKGYGYAMATSQYNPDIALGETYRQDRCAAGFEWKSKEAGSDYYKNRCVYVRAEGLLGRDGDCKSYGAYVTSAIPVYKGLDIVAMADYMNYNTDMGLKKANLMAGVQYWFFKKCRIQAQYQYAMLGSNLKALDGGDYGSLLTQVQVYF